METMEMVVRIRREGTMGLALATALTVAWPAAGPLRAQEGDTCPAPKVEVRNRVSGERYRPAGGLGFEPGSPGEEMLAGVHEAVINELIEANRDDVRFFEGFGAGSPDVDFVLTADGVTTGDPVAPGGWLLTSTLGLADVKGRAVRPNSSVDYTAADLPAERAGIVDRIADPFRPMLRLIREHQVRIREREGGAIYATAALRPERAEVAQEEELTLTLELYDCGPGSRVPLADREVRLEHSGVGRLDRTTVTTDAGGTAEVVFVSREPGTAEVVAVWPYENTEGRALTADGGIATIRVGPGLALNVALGPGYHPDDRSRTWYGGGVYVLAEEEVDRYLPDGGAPVFEEYAPPGCRAGVKWKRGGTPVPRDRAERWEDESTIGPQLSRVRIAARMDTLTAAEVRVQVSGHAEAKAEWHEEEGSQTESFAAFDLIVEVENPGRQDYILTVGWPTLTTEADGATDYSVRILADAAGCEKGDPDVDLMLVDRAHDYVQGSSGGRRGRSGGSRAIRVRGDRAAQFVFRVFAVITTWSGKLHPPYTGTGAVDLVLRVEATPIPPQGS
jgi:hypothetical protein